jgi:Iron only nitrogenase protein AnfO (AnfO_nitrog).
MGKEIAVFIGPDGTSAPLDQRGKVVVYRRAQGSWEADRERAFFIGEAGGMRELRQMMGEMLQFLGGCRIVVARSATGVPYFELEKSGRSVWEYTGRPADFLEQVWEGEEKDLAAAKTQEPQALPSPVEQTPGNFFINIKEIQGQSADVTSKQILQQFVRRGAFRTLAIICSHIPPWIEVEATTLGFSFEAEQLGKNEFRVRLAKKMADA